MKYFIVYFTNGQVEVHETKGRAFLDLCEENGYSLMQIEYKEESDHKNTRNYCWNGEEWVRKPRTMGKKSV